MHNNVLMAMEQQEVTALTALDLSAAFDKVDHQILLHILNKRMGVTGTALKWIENYLRPQSFQDRLTTLYPQRKAYNSLYHRSSAI